MQDTTFEMEKQRNRPIKYNREVVHKSVKAMQKVEEVRLPAALLSYCCLRRLSHVAAPGSLLNKSLLSRRAKF